MFRVIGVVAALAVVVAAADSGDRVEMFSRQRPSAGWTRTGPSPLDAVVPLKFAVKQRNVEELMKIVDSVATPSSPLYGKVRAGCQISEEKKSLHTRASS